mmetsp:Transcript_29813/g.55032  ORF Transcript_29813/g.55032 Transcript_29813/m.55032 type:complete len:1030 (+) Transcript_29813:29-3118(+)
MDDFERAILVVFSQDPSITPDVRTQATNYIDAVKGRADAWQFCWELFVQRERLEVKFWCLQTITSVIPTLAAEFRSELRRRLLSWLQTVGSSKKEDVAIRNKIALVYVGLLKADYPAAWPGGWRDLIALLDSGPILLDLFLKVLVIFDQEVLSHEAPRNEEERNLSQLIKGAMKEGDLGHLVECWYKILVTFQGTAPELVTDCLRVIAAYSVWIEVSLVANERFFDAFCNLISEAGPSSKEACDCLGAIIEKKLEPAKKVHMLTELSVLQRLHGCLHSDASVVVDLALIEKEAELANSLAEAVLEAYEELRWQPAREAAALAEAAWELITALMPSIFRFFAHEEFQMADSVEPFLTQLFTKVKAYTANASADPDLGPCHVVSQEQMRPIMRQTLQLIVRRIVYPDWFQHNDVSCEDDEQHLNFLEFRRSLTKMYKRIFTLEEQMGLEFVQASIAQLTQQLHAVRPMEVEAVLHLFKEAGDIVKDLVQHLKARGPLVACFLQLVDCEMLVKADHWAVQLGLLEIYVRYVKIFAIHADLFTRYGERVLEAFIGSQGLRASDPRVVTRACFMFGRFVKMARAQVAPFTMHVYEALQGLMVVPYIPSTLRPAQSNGQLPKVVVKGTLKTEDRGCLFEAIAMLIVCLPAEQMRPALQTVLKAPAGNLAEILNMAPARLATDVQGYVAWSAESIEAVAAVSKAFSAQQAITAPDWEEVLVLVARVLESLAMKQEVQQAAACATSTTTGMSRGRGTPADLWHAALFLSRRMVEILGDQFLRPLDTLLPMLCTSADQADLTELLIFAHHAASHLKAQELFQKWFSMLFTRAYEVWKQMPEDSEQCKREKQELGCALLQLLKECGQKCPVVLLEPVMLQSGPSRHGQDVLHFLLLCLQDPAELRALLLAAATWSALLDVAIGSANTQEALAVLPLAKLMQQLLWSVARMDYNDVQAQRVLSEAAVVLRCLTSVRLLPQGAQQQAAGALEQALVGALPGLQSAEGPRRLYEALAQECSLKEIRAVLQQCVLDWRRDCGG